MPLYRDLWPDDGTDSRRNRYLSLEHLFDSAVASPISFGGGA